ncbi:peptide methionine sulfoxide reductase, putative [Eimeria tenella]|uniref:peptide-methionine (S)-S-oxide reductase n=1 Tax=Eimeria tenella TaxID=5802 RepID=U6KSC4_EIMTE|nr:peptide methionine sulfoxide reductase, putative [Eimeria tenella]CDJ40876.1 peptide methionine sulfoxide reductase, putative [Eimeria tenella]|eukprot:XP_013231626.1 peptide methionine sulfoxide reductase, putative [Eimeria tenella]
MSLLNSSSGLSVGSSPAAAAAAAPAAAAAAGAPPAGAAAAPAAAPAAAAAAAPPAAAAAAESIVLGGGCFWGLEKLFVEEFKDKLEATCVGYAGGHTPQPTYAQVCSSKTGHFEALKISFFPQKVHLRELLTFFWTIHDPTTPDRQGPDVGPQYRSAVCVSDPTQLPLVLQIKNEMQKKWNFKIQTEIISDPNKCHFWPAEDHHQKYLFKNPGGYCSHRKHF